MKTAFLLFFLFFAVPLASAQTVSIGDYSTTIDSEVIVLINISDAESVAGGVVNVSFDPSIVSVEYVATGDFGNPVANINNNSGWVKLVAARVDNVNKNEAVLANVVFRGVSAGTTDLQILYASLNNEGCELISPSVSNGNVTVTDNSGGPLDKTLIQVEGQPEVYWHQNNRLYWITDWNVINQMSGIPGWDSVNTLPASEFNPSNYQQGPRFITIGYESDGLLIREQGHFEVYLILNGEKHHFTSPEALTWNGYGFDDVIEVSAAIVGMFPEGTPISLQDKKLLRKPGGIDVFWSQNGELYYVNADAMTKMQGIFGWGWDDIVEPADFNPSDSSSYKTFITTGPESDGILIRQWGGYEVYRIENGFRRHITYSDVMDLYGYSMDDVIDVSEQVENMFTLGNPIGIEVDLSFSKKTDSGEIPGITEFTTGDTIKFYTQTTVSESYSVDTYVKLTEPSGRTRYAYYNSPNFLPTDPLSFSETEIRLYPDHWDAVTKNWNWDEYTFSNDEEGVYTWEFYYKDTASGKVLGWDKKSYVFVKKTDLGLNLEISTDKLIYRENEPIVIYAKVQDSNGNNVLVNNFEVRLNNFPQVIDFEQVSSIYGNYLITGLNAPALSFIDPKIDVAVLTQAGNAFDTTNFKVFFEDSIDTYKVLMILACPSDLYDPNTHLPTVSDWYSWDQETGTPQWYKAVANTVENYYKNISYDKVELDVITTDEWIRLDGVNECDDVHFCYSPRPENINLRREYNDAIDKVEQLNKYNLFEFDIIVVVDPTYGTEWIFGDKMGQGITLSSDNPGNYGEQMIVVSTRYNNANSFKDSVSIIGHEITHAITYKNKNLKRIGNDHGDNHDQQNGMCVMAKGMAGMQPFCPIDGEKMGFTNYDEIKIPHGFKKKALERTLLPIEGGANRAIHPQPAFIRTYDLIWDTAISGFRFKENIIEYNYWIEFRNGITWNYVNRGVLIWRSLEQNPENNILPNRDHPQMFGMIYQTTEFLKIYDWDSDFNLIVTSITDEFAQIKIKYNTDVFVIAEKISSTKYEVEMFLVGTFFDNFPYNFSVIDTLDYTEVFNSTLTTNINGEFDIPIIFNVTILNNIESHPYLIRVQTVEGWVPFLIATPSIIDGISNENPMFSVSDPIETNSPGDLINLSSTTGSMKLSLKTAMPVDTGSYKYIIYLDVDNSTVTGFAINDIGADYKIEYTGAGAILFNNSSSWTSVDTPYLAAMHNGTNIEILISTEIMNGSDTIKLVAQTIDSSDNLYDTLPDPTSSQPYLQYFDVHPIDVRFNKSEYYSGDKVTVNGYGFAPNQIIPIAIKNQTDYILWEGSVLADSNGLVITSPIWTVPFDLEGSAYLYWLGAKMDSFLKAYPPLPVYHAEFDLYTPMVVGTGREFNVTVNFENVGADLTNLTLNLNTSGMTSVPETIIVGDLASGENYTHTWELTSTAPGFALLKAEMQSDQTILMTRQRGIYIANISVGIHALDDTINGGIFEFNVSATNNQENITYTDLLVNTSIRYIETNFVQPFISLTPSQTMNQSFSWDTINEDPGTYQIEANLIYNGIILASTEKSVNLKPGTTLNLYNGWNLISLPLMSEDTSITSILSQVSGNYSIVWAYNASDTSDHWKKYDPGVPFGNDLTNMEPGKGYWIMMTSDDTLNIGGTMPEPTDIELWSGWNLIGYNSLNPQTITDALSSINGNYSIIWAYNASDSTDYWNKYDPNTPFGNDLANMEPGKGYWIMMTADDILEI